MKDADSIYDIRINLSRKLNAERCYYPYSFYGAVGYEATVSHSGEYREVTDFTFHGHVFNIPTKTNLYDICDEYDFNDDFLRLFCGFRRNRMMSLVYPWCPSENGFSSLRILTIEGGKNHRNKSFPDSVMQSLEDTMVFDYAVANGNMPKDFFPDLEKKQYWDGNGPDWSWSIIIPELGLSDAQIATIPEKPRKARRREKDELYDYGKSSEVCS